MSSAAFENASVFVDDVTVAPALKAQHLSLS